MSRESSPTPQDLILVAPDQLHLYWKEAREFLMPAVEHAGEINEEILISRLLQGEYQLFLVYAGPRMIGAATGAIRQYPTHTVAYMVHLGGDFMKMRNFLSDFESWARVKGATKLRIQGRLGWQRRLLVHNFVSKMIVMEKDL